MRNILGGLAVAFLLLCGLIAPASAALPDGAYQGDFWSRIAGGWSCTVHTVHHPKLIVRPLFTDGAFGADHLQAGQYVFWNGANKRCEIGGAVTNPKL